MPTAALNIQMLTTISAPQEHPGATLTIFPPFKVLGGGAFVDYRDPGVMLTASGPLFPDPNLGLPSSTPFGWFANAKDHEAVAQGAITVYALALYDPNDDWDVVCVGASSDLAAHPEVSVTLPKVTQREDRYHLTGGGAFVNYRGAGNLLTASFPADHHTWMARSKDHIASDPAVLTAYAIGIRSTVAGVKLKNHIISASGGEAAHPSASVILDPEWKLSGGGAQDQTSGEGNLLTASSPDPDAANGWSALGKDHTLPSPGIMTAYAIGLQTF